MLPVQAVLFDVNGTLVDIITDEQHDRVYRAIGHLLAYSGIHASPGHVRDTYFATVDDLLEQSPEEYPEFDAVAVWHAVIDRLATAYTRSLPGDRLEQLPLFLAQAHRGLARRRLRRFPRVRGVLNELRSRYRLGVVTDAQRAYARPELDELGLLDYFDPIVVSGELGFRKPDKRMFATALDVLAVDPGHAVYVGNDIFRDIHGARQAGLSTVLYAPDGERDTGREGACTPDHVITDHRQLVTLLASGDIAKQSTST